MRHFLLHLVLVLLTVGASNYNTVSMGIRLIKTGNPLKVEDQQRIRTAAGVVEQVAGVLWKLRQDQAAAIEAVKHVPLE